MAGCGCVLVEGTGMQAPGLHVGRGSSSTMAGACHAVSLLEISQEKLFFFKTKASLCLSHDRCDTVVNAIIASQ